MNKQFEIFLEECASSLGEDYIDVPEEMQAPHKFSRRFDRKMRKLMRQRSGGFSVPKLPCKRRLSMMIALTVLIFLSLMTAVICSGRNLFSNFFTEVFADNTVVWNIPQENSPDKIEDLYGPTWLPDGYELYDAHVFPEGVWYYYCNIPGCTHQKDENHIVFKQLPKGNYHRNIDNETSDFVAVTINDAPGIEVVGCGYYIVWNNEDYTFVLSAYGDINENCALKIAEFVEKAE